MAELITLQNGMRLYVDPMNALESAAVGIWSRAGAMDEAPEESGVAHLLEHMAFKGTTRRTARDIVEEIEDVGGYLNAGTSYQRTGYYARVLKNDVETAIDLLADILLNPLFDDAELLKERDVVVQEIGEAWDAPDDAVFDLLQSVSFAEQALGRPILGSLESVRSHKRERLTGFMDRLYRPSNMVMAVAGAVDPDKVAAWAEARFSADRSNAVERVAPKRAAPTYTGGGSHDSRDIEQTHLAIAFPGVGANDPDFYAARIAAEALGGGMSSRLFQSIREERGLAYSIYAYADCYDDAGLVGVYAGTEPDRALETATLIREEIDAFASNVTESEIERAGAMLKSTLLMGLESPMSRIDNAAAQLFTFGEVFTPSAISTRLDRVSVGDVKRCAVRMIENAAPSIAVVGPTKLELLAEAIGAAG